MLTEWIKVISENIFNRSISYIGPDKTKKLGIQL